MDNKILYEGNILYISIVEKIVNNLFLFLFDLVVSSWTYPHILVTLKKQVFLFYIAFLLYNLWKTV